MVVVDIIKLDQQISKILIMEKLISKFCQKEKLRNQGQNLNLTHILQLMAILNMDQQISKILNMVKLVSNTCQKGKLKILKLSLNPTPIF